MPHAHVVKLSTIMSLGEEEEEEMEKTSQMMGDDDIFISSVEKTTFGTHKLVTSKPFKRRESSCQSPSKEKRNTEIDNIINSCELESNVDIREMKPEYDETGVRTYTRACKKFGVSPISNCIKCLENGKDIDLKFYGIDTKCCLALSMAMVINTTVTSLNLRGNQLETRSLDYLEKMLEENMSITELNLAENNLRTHGAKVVCRILDNNKTLKYLNISQNNFSDTDGIILAKGIEEHSDLTGLDLSHNNFGDLSAPYFKTMLAETTTMQELDLSWNHFLRAGAQCLAEGIGENVCIKELNLSWNGFEDDGAGCVGRALETNSVIKTIDLSSNRIGPEGFLSLISAFKQNDTLEVLKVGKNNVPDQAAEAAVDLFLGLSTVGLQVLDLSDVIFRKSFNQKLQELHDLHKDLEVIHGYTDSYGKRKMISYNAVDDALNIIVKYIKGVNVSVIELFRKFDLDGSQSVSYQEFEQGLKEAGIILSSLQLELLIKKLDQDGDGEIDFSELVAIVDK